MPAQRESKASPLAGLCWFTSNPGNLLTSSIPLHRELQVHWTVSCIHAYLESFAWNNLQRCFLSQFQSETPGKGDAAEEKCQNILRTKQNREEFVWLSSLDFRQPCPLKPCKRMRIIYQSLGNYMIMYLLDLYPTFHATAYGGMHSIPSSYLIGLKALK